MSDPCEDRSEGAASDSSKSGRLKKAANQKQLDFELEFFERILAQQSDHIDVLRVHGNNLTSKGLYARGLLNDRRLAQLRPHDPSVHYNLACSYSLLQMNDAAIASLDSSLKLGYRDFEHLLHDPDLEHIRGDVRFVSLLGRHLKKWKQSRQIR